MDEEQIHGQNVGIDTSSNPLSGEWQFNPKSALSNFMHSTVGKTPEYIVEEGKLNGKRIFRYLMNVTDKVFGVGDGYNRREAEKASALSANYAIIKSGLAKVKAQAPVAASKRGPITLSDGTVMTYERARQFMDYYCRRFDFDKPDIDFEARTVRGQTSWEATMSVGGRRIGLGSAKTKKDAQTNCYLDVTQYLESCDKQLWQHFVEAAKSGKDLGLAPNVYFTMSDRLVDVVQDLCGDIKKSTLFKNRPAVGNMASESSVGVPNSGLGPWRPRPVSAAALADRSKELSDRRASYLANSKLDKMRQTREALPVYSRSSDILKHIEENEITIVMAATGSGKTTQIPQLILDSWIEKNQGGKCNIFCTQPRRIAAMSVATRIANERGETLGKGGSVGYQVRFEQKLPDENGSVTFCTIGVFLRKMQTALLRGEDRVLDNVTHVIVDEVHERDVDTDLLLVVLKRLLADRKAKGNPLKVVLMSATIDPTLFQKYFPSEDGEPAKVVEVPGRSFPVEKHFLDEFIRDLPRSREIEWVFRDDKVKKYLDRQLGVNATSIVSATGAGPSRVAAATATRSEQDDDLEIPYPLVALTIAHVMKKSESGHVLVFLPGWDEIQHVHKIITDRHLSLGVNLADSSRYGIHILHSTIPLAEQQQIFETPPPGIRRIILSTNIAETSVTIPDVVYVVDTAKIKENRFDPERHISSLVSAWVGTSNLNQRAGRAGRHRPGEYYGIISKDQASRLHTHQTVEIKRVDLSNVVMHVKALNFPGMETEEVLASCIEPPAPERVAAAIQSLTMAGALDHKKALTSLGRVLLQLPVEVQVGKLVLLGSLFRCLDQALTLAAILTNRDPFLCPPLMKKEAQAAKDSWADEEFRSDALSVLNAYNTWWEFERKGDYSGASRFCGDNFLSKATLLTISKIKAHLLQSLYDAGVIDISAGGLSVAASKSIPPQLNENGDSLPLLAALIATAAQPKFAVRTSPMTYRTPHDKAAAIHPSSVNHRKREKTESDIIYGEKQIFAFAEKRQNLSVTGQAPGQVYLVGCSRLDPMSYMLFGAYNTVASERGLICDEWLPIIGNVGALDDVRDLKSRLEGCMLRVFEGIHHSRQRSSRNIILARRAREVEEDEAEDDVESSFDAMKNPSLSSTEVKELDTITQDVVRILNRYADERKETMSRRNSRPVTPIGSPALNSLRLPGPQSGRRSGTSTPYYQNYDSRPATPSRLR
ncbi:P-loop containing nucleoside triphosphate hydrolase protein [Schizopora paradoxa]|uniref:p-loop containing nucleoside triphosphate hydrolase protein n=1 Tax=Schizopora paradoxa TaxID=27342 RepID=A0A0H2RSA6_9AGAM|nr:P-loop containing nucleoside triphosphate hydrolase protein [Schizopora paradoxa]